MQRKNLASKIVSILLSAAMIVSTPMTTLATDGDVQVAEQAEVQIASDVVDDTDADVALAESDADTAFSGDIAEEDVTEEHILDEDITIDGEEDASVDSADESGEMILGDEEESEVPMTLSDDEIALAIDGEGDTTAAANAKVTLTVSNQGVLASAKDGSVMVHKEVTVSDINQDGYLTYDEALVAAHKAYNSADGYATEAYTDATYGDGIKVTKFWGVDTEATGFYLNGTWLLSNVGDTTQSTVKDGDALYAWVYKDGTYYSDQYAVFDADTKETTTGEDITLTLTAGGTAAVGVSVGTWNAGAFSQLEGKTTDDNGQVTLSFSEAGTYLITANGTVRRMITTNWTTGDAEEMDCLITAPVCVVTVTEGPSVVAKGTCGATDTDNVTWKLTEDGVLTISGMGAMADYKSKTASWYENRDQVKSIAVEAGVTYLYKARFTPLYVYRLQRYQDRSHPSNGTYVWGMENGVKSYRICSEITESYMHEMRI